MEIKFENTTTGYNHIPMIRNLNLSLKSGSSTCVLGANGIGKTTLFKTLLGLLDIVDGNIFIDNKSITQMSHREIARALSYVPQAKNYTYQYSVIDIVLMGRAMYIKKFSEPSKNDIEAAENALERLNLLSYKNRMYSELSGGEQQIVLIARALAQDADFVVMDEPASNLDFGNQKKLIDVIKLLNKTGKGVLMASHSPDHALSCCSNAILIALDRTVSFGPINEIITQENLKAVYGVDVSILCGTNADGKNVQSCVLS